MILAITVSWCAEERPTHLRSLRNSCVCDLSAFFFALVTYGGSSSHAIFVGVGHRFSEAECDPYFHWPCCLLLVRNAVVYYRCHRRDVSS
ncbi:hypothetical protein TIFTF001_011031 [Ficus carica]|uniref:Uncharacterized protein n=1 Tax=Ficus carica TaxID=3494 RepID=A0AA87ZZ66_FICCA|nr:hypothetical protein TIFTF001_011031 [Ficus carica]